MGKIADVVVPTMADLEDEDYFEEFDLDMPQKGDSMELDKKEDEDEIFGEAEKWDDDDIEEDFSIILKTELKIADKVDDFDIDVITKQEIATREAKRLKKKNRAEALNSKELELLGQEKVLDLRKRIYNSYTFEFVEEKKTEARKKAKVEPTAVDLFYTALGMGASDKDEVNKDEFANDLKPVVLKSKDIPKSMQRDNLIEKTKDLQRKEKMLVAHKERFLKHRHIQVAKLLPATASEDAVSKREEEETIKAVETRQAARRRASLVLGHGTSTNMSGVTNQDMTKTVQQIATDVAFAETIEESELLPSEDNSTEPTGGGRATRSSSSTSGGAGTKCLPYKAAKDDAIDAAVGAELTAAKFDRGFKLTARKAPNTRYYQLENGEIVRVKVVHKVVLASDAAMTGPYVTLITFLNNKLAK